MQEVITEFMGIFAAKLNEYLNPPSGPDTINTTPGTLQDVTAEIVQRWFGPPQIDMDPEILQAPIVKIGFWIHDNAVGVAHEINMVNSAATAVTAIRQMIESAEEDWSGGVGGGGEGTGGGQGNN